MVQFYLLDTISRLCFPHIDSFDSVSFQVVPIVSNVVRCYDNVSTTDWAKFKVNLQTCHRFQSILELY